jgi:hypothetical protein
MKLFILFATLFQGLLTFPVYAQEPGVRLHISNIHNHLATLHIGVYQKGRSAATARMTFQIDVLPDGSDTLLVTLPAGLRGDYAVAVSQDVLFRQENNIFNSSSLVYERSLPKKISMTQFDQCHISVSAGSASLDIPVVYQKQ